LIMKDSFRTHTMMVKQKSWLFLFVLLGVFLFTGCSKAGLSQGSYPVDFFTEMHYQQSYKINEPPSLSAPSGSVPVSVAIGSEFVVDLTKPHPSEVEYSLAEAKNLKNPILTKISTIELGNTLFQTNCAMCHGASGLGDGSMVQHFKEAGYSGVPANLSASGPSYKKSDGEIYQILTKGFAATYGVPEGQMVMPPFGRLLSAEDRWTIVHYIRSLQGK